MLFGAAGVLKDEPIHDQPIERFYPIGTPGQPWTAQEDEEWKQQTKLQRSYQTEVVDKLQALVASNPLLELVQYGALSHNPSRYPLYAVRSKSLPQSNKDDDKPIIMVTGGVHGYETSGVQGAILFLQTHASQYLPHAHLLVAPCVSPWAYEHIQRWQHGLLDPNRSFGGDGSTEESKALIEFLRFQNRNLQDRILCHVDLHETTDTDATEFMPAKHAKAGLNYRGETIPDGFYLVGNSELPQTEFQKAVIENVAKVTHIAEPDAQGEIIEVPIAQHGLILVPIKELGLCCSVTNAKYCSTTEVYPDSPRATEEICNQAQVAAITGAMDYVLTVKHR